VAGVGEQWESSARRELAEEAGITGQPLVDLGPIAYDEADGRIVGRVFLARYDGPLSCPDGEVVGVDRVPLAELDTWMEGRAVCPDSKAAALPVVRAHVSS
jgi:8-oxo-dGTP pyrophosphatase MutT (NUDIX family)